METAKHSQTRGHMGSPTLILVGELMKKSHEYRNPENVYSWVAVIHLSRAVLHRRGREDHSSDMRCVVLQRKQVSIQLLYLLCLQNKAHLVSNEECW